MNAAASFAPTGAMTMPKVGALLAGVSPGDLARIDLSGITQVDSSALAVLVQWKRANPALSIEGAPEALRVLADLYDVGFLLDA
ncbi:MAG: STAS domain-containing protein [Zoogloeaceae bacterium]|jgi:phospholipid transport system transporter-binding protein|nr:STAS domain-containing protein [Zoogloeaceae bacterium]